MAETERTMLDRLNVRYSGRTRNGRWEGAKYLRAEHVPTGLRHSRNRICDFIATGMHSTPYVRDEQTAFPPIYHGHEVKVSRSDWLAELRDPGKSEAFRPHMHYWWLVAADRSIVRDDLPDGWGLMVPHGRHSLRVVVHATLNATPEPVPHAMAGALLRASVTTEGTLAAHAAHPVCCDGTSQEVSSQQDRDESPAPEVSRGVAETWPYGDVSAAVFVAAASWPWERQENRDEWAPKMLTDAALADREIARARRNLDAAAQHVRDALPAEGES